MRVGLDTNILAYAEGVNGAAMKRAALELVRKLPEEAGRLPVQALGELYHVLVRKAGRTRTKARAAILSWRDAFPVIETSDEVMLAAADLATSHQFVIWDAVILSAAAGGRLPPSSVGRLAAGFHLEGDHSDEPIFVASAPAFGSLACHETGILNPLNYRVAKADRWNGDWSAESLEAWKNMPKSRNEAINCFRINKGLEGRDGPRLSAQRGES